MLQQRSRIRPFLALGVLSATIGIGVLGAFAAQTEQEVSENAKNTMSKEAFYCNLNAMTAAERAQHEKLGKQLKSARLETKELADGYAFRLRKEMITTVEVTDWVSKEDKCCSFFHFEIEVQPNKGPFVAKDSRDRGD